MKASDVVRHIAEGIEFKKNSVAFTIDDAYVSFYENGWPLFRDNDIPATLFVSTDMTTSSYGCKNLFEHPLQILVLVF